ncbi:MAG: quinate 5-dehydrogenase [Chthonomonas sp.]|nr:quinate 5-dehydrogenase [Chthonomonas sp.]
MDRKRIVSVSLGSSKRNKSSEATMLGQDFLLERIGTDGDMAAFQRMFEELDGKVAALGVGGADIYLVAGERRYAFRQILNCIKNVKVTPVVDGSGLKHTLERRAIHWLQESGTVDFKQERALLVSATDRYGMAQALDQLCPNVVYADLMFGVGLPIPLRSYRAVERLGRIVLPLITQLPFKWVYPTGEKQDSRTPKFAKTWAEATFICGDSLYVLRYAPDRLDGKTILTQSVRQANLDWLKSAGVRRVITTTPVIGGETFATNVMEAMLVAILDKPVAEITEADYLGILDRLDWKPTVIELNA